MEHKDRAIKAETLKSEIEEIEANLATIERHLQSATDGARAQFEADRTETREELAARKKELEALLQGADGKESPEIRREMLQKAVEDLEADIASCDTRLNLASGDARKLYESEKADLHKELEQRRKDLGAA